MNDDFESVPWLVEAQKRQDELDAEQTTDLAKCQALIALLRRAMRATVPALRQGIDLTIMELLLCDATDGKKTAVEEIEKAAGW